MSEFTISYNVPSQNERDGWHWSRRSRDTKRAEFLIRFTNKSVSPAKGKRFVHILAYRKRKCDDIANLIGGAKGLCDAIVRAGLLIDDKDTMATITYEQKTLSALPLVYLIIYGRSPATTVSFTDYTDASK